MKVYRIVGGPDPRSVRIYAPDGKDITDHVLAVNLSVNPARHLTATLFVMAEAEVAAEVEGA